MDGVSRNRQSAEVKSNPITQLTNQGKVVVGYEVYYKIDNLTKGMHNIEVGCIGRNCSSRTIRDNAKINKL